MLLSTLAVTRNQIPETIHAIITVFASVADDRSDRTVSDGVGGTDRDVVRLVDAEISLWSDVVPRVRLLDVGLILVGVRIVSSFVGQNVLEVRSILLNLWHRLKNSNNSDAALSRQAE